MSQIFAGLILLGVLVVFHELGHFLVAKACGVRVLVFSVGFGPKLLSFKWGETEYKICAILLGGYVRMYGDNVLEEVPQDQQGASFFHQPILKKSAIAAAGPFFNFILPIFLFFFLFLGKEQVLLPVVGTVLPNEPAAQAGLQALDRIVSVDGNAVHSFEDVVEQVSKRPNLAVDLEISRGENAAAQKLHLRVVPRADANPNPFDAQRVLGRIGVMSGSEKPSVVSYPNSPASQAGVEPFDEVLAVNDKRVHSYQDIETHIKNSPDASTHLRLLRRPKGKPEDIVEVSFLKTNSSHLSVGQGLTPLRYAVTQNELDDKSVKDQLSQSRASLEKRLQSPLLRSGLLFAGLAAESIEPDSPAAALGLQPGDALLVVDGKDVQTPFDVMRAFEKGPEAIHVVGFIAGGVAKLGVVRLKQVASGGQAFGGPSRIFGQQFPNTYINGPTVEVFVGPGQALMRALRRTWEMIRINAQSLWMLATLKVPASELGGPIAIFGVAGQAAQQGPDLYLTVMALLSINLGILNLLPIPVLDGGHLLLFGIEAVQRKPLTIKTRQIATKIGFLILLAFMVWAMVNDLTRVFG